MGKAPFKFPPGIFRNGTEYSVKGRWYNGNLTRWINDIAQPVGGWKLFFSITANESIRAILSYVDNDRIPWNIVGTADTLYAVDDEADNIYDITPTTLSFNPGGQVGFGSGAFGAGAFGSSTPSSVIINEDDIWVFDNWGENVLAAHTGDGRIFEWDPNSPSTEAAALTGTGVPAGISFMLVTDERHCVALGGTNNPRLVKWCSREDLTDWDPADDTNTAGSKELQTQGYIIAGVKVPGGVLIITSVDAHLMYFVGGVDVYGFRKVADNCGIKSTKSLVGIPNGAVWVGNANFWKYEGSIERLQCDVLDYFFTDGNLSRPILVHGGLNKKFQEVWWFRPSIGQNIPNEYVVWSYRSNKWWSIGELTRTSMANFANSDIPLMANGQNVYKHETGYLNESATRDNIFLESSVLELSNGDSIMKGKSFYHDIQEPFGDTPIEISFDLRGAPNSAFRSTGPITLNVDRGYTNLRWRARQAKLRINQIEDELWKLGECRLDVKEVKAKR